MIWALLVIGFLFLIPLFFKTVGFVLKIFFGILGPVIIILMIVFLILGIIF